MPDGTLMKYQQEIHKQSELSYNIDSNQNIGINDELELIPMESKPSTVRRRLQSIKFSNIYVDSKKTELQPSNNTIY